MVEYTYRIEEVRINKNYYFRVVLLQRICGKLKRVKSKSFNKVFENSHENAVKYLRYLETMYF